MLKTVPFEYPFASHPRCEFWNYELNDGVKPEDVSKWSKKKYWFNCDKCNHSFIMALNNISSKKNRWCPYCAIPSRILCNDDSCERCFNKSFASHEKSIHWSDKNGDKNPRDVFKACDTKYYLKCDACNHDFKIALSSLKIGNWCGFCGNMQLCDDNDCTMCYNNSFASCEKSIFWSDKNGDIKPRNLFKGISNKYLFNCETCNHTFEMGLYSIIKGGWCNYCANRVLCEDNNCITCFNKSFASSKKSIYWDTESNGIITPRNAFLNSANKYYFKCNNCNHLFQTDLNSINNNGWCPYCCVPPKRLCDDNNCIHCFNNSFASHPNAIFWSDRNVDIIPRQIFKGTHVKYLFDCNVCNHTFQMMLNSITTKGCWCNYCGNRILCDDTSCEICFKKSFANNKKSLFWDYAKNEKKPRDVYLSTAEKFWFICIKKHSFNSKLSHITDGSWCPYCINKTEGVLFEFLQAHYPTIIKQFSPDWIGQKRFDFCIPEHKIIIELDGIQHFIQVSNWKSPEHNLKNDKEKEKQANDNGFSIIRILQEDVASNTYDWQSLLLQNVKNVKEVVDTDGPMNIYMCHNDEYDGHQLDNGVELL